MFSVTMAKGIGNGFPLAAVVTRPEIAKTLTEAAYFNTYGGNPLASTVGLNVLKIIDDENLQNNCLIVGSKLLKDLEKLRDKYPEVIGDVRGKGLMIGLELTGNAVRNTFNYHYFSLIIYFLNRKKENL